MSNILRLRNNIDIQQLLSSTTYKTDFFDKCIYCHKSVENDYYQYKGKLIGMPYRCDCSGAELELKAKEVLLEKLISLQKSVDVKIINKATKEAILGEINRAYEENSEDILRSIID
jgi:hypothetical protein